LKLSVCFCFCCRWNSSGERVEISHSEAVACSKCRSVKFKKQLAKYLDYKNAEQMRQKKGEQQKLMKR